MGVAVDEVDAALQRVLTAIDKLIDFNGSHADNGYDMDENQRLLKQLEGCYQDYERLIGEVLSQSSRHTQTTRR
jgi:hypothetical protein